ncbi:NAD-dependent epimerase/dehydratase family protein [Paracoccus marinaquae]|uniref:NAD-dependent epimerase/dehydratase domain-containing protein n=1 Tax=Paracoccus marinaquae TaxID=2841926 RepID=A0ABS6ADV9_9RHOB|nr:NAD-dependent epimerase/dehydratase family protein [Paracoccus marinaquae]MBU3028784.1 hypothetical protein [Paracoccus marinaquae]
MKGRVWILGGTGQVGAHVARLLEADGAGIVTVSRRGSAGYEHVAADLSAQDTHLPFEAGDRVINLTEATGAAIMRSAIRLGAVLIETSATPEYMLSFRDLARREGGPGMLLDCVGVAPGLTNLMAHELRRLHPDLRRLHIGAELGLGAHAGPAAMRWFYESLGTRLSVRRDGRMTEIATGRLVRRFPFADGKPDRIALNFPFVEQRILAEEFGPSVETVQVFLGISPPWVTHLLRCALRLGFGGLGARFARPLARATLAGPTLGEATTRIVVCGSDSRGHRIVPLRLETGEPSIATAAVIAAAAGRARPSPGRSISSIADCLTLDDAVRAIRNLLPETRLTSADREAVTTAGGACDRSGST